MGATPTEATPKLVNAGTAAAIVGYSIYTLRRLAASGALPAVRLGPRHLRFRLADLEAFVAADRLPRAVDSTVAAGASTRGGGSVAADAPASRREAA